MEQSVIPIIRASTAPVLPYMLCAFRDQPQEKVDFMLKPAIRLVNLLKTQISNDNETQHLRNELMEVLHIMSEKLSYTDDQLRHSLLQTISVNLLFLLVHSVLVIFLYFVIKRNIPDPVLNVYCPSLTLCRPCLILGFLRIARNWLYRMVTGWNLEQLLEKLD